MASCISTPSSSFRLQLTRTSFIAAPSLPLYPRSKCELNRRSLAFKGIMATGVSVMASTLTSQAQPSQDLSCGRFAILDIAKNRGHQLQSRCEKELERLAYKPEGYNYWKWRDHKIHYVVQGEGPPIVLIHGFGASAFHWRYNIPELAKKHKVYAIDLLGFGWSDKALVDYDAMVWRDQVVDFLKEIVKEPAVLIQWQQHRHLNTISPLIFCRLMTRFMMNQSTYTLDSVLSDLSCPLLLLWGDLDPWVGPAKANRIKEFYPKSTLVNLQAGHCPHDEVPELVNKALLDWLATLTPQVTLQAV
ncbi:hypothetical protein TSUD_211460 [Trifolium subterraneum]|uniref:AB hydrolase-1 domain-containing protein n=2 Tax=Trifolium TaxID=3898 RepID=A0A2Z6MU28_TRISU|nr:hypothetical protein TSUD_211460 [Trifolium subterraneum]